LELSELDTIAARLLQEQKELDDLTHDIKQLEADLREYPRRAEGEKKFYALIGLDWDEPKLKEKLKELSERREVLSKTISEENAKIFEALSEKNLIVPLDPKPAIDGGNTSFKYRANISYSNAVQELANILGLTVPLRVDDVVIEHDKITVSEVDPHYAMDKVVTAFDKISKTVALKLDRPGGWNSRL
jgi:hypothetical protein